MNASRVVRFVPFAAILALPPAFAPALPPALELPDLAWIGSAESFGSAVAISGDTVMIGAPLDDTAGADVGAVTVIRNGTGGWQQETKLLPPNPTAFIEFGCSVAIDGDVAVVGALHDDQAAINSGAAFVYRRLGTSWTLDAKLVPADGQAWDEFGTSVAISNDAIVVGAPKDDDVAANAGSVRVYRRIGQQWVLEAKLLPPSGHAADKFGASVDVAGDVVVGGLVGDSTLGALAGAAHVFRRGPLAWSHEAKLLASDGSSADQFGWTVATDGDDVIVGAPAAGTTTVHPGYAYVFHHAAGAWPQQAKLSAADAENYGWKFGMSVAIDGDTALVGRSWIWSPPAARSAHLFKRLGTSWSELFKLEPFDNADSVAFGEAVALDGAMVVVGDPGIHQATLFDTAIPSPPVPGDVNGDGCVNASDIGELMSAFWIPNSAADLDGDGVVGGGDLAIVLAGWGGGC